ncbi:MAG: hypothetical protein JWO42_2805 [Chloroflexi bacterium]|nr:hypothetical protein [Chloroflexota bacterium]
MGIATVDEGKRVATGKQGGASRERYKPPETEEVPAARVVDEPRRLLAELIGTFALTMVAAGGIVIASVSNGEVSPGARIVAPALVVLALIYAIGDVSGAHFNPSVTIAFAVRRVFEWHRVPGYVLAQLCGAILAALLLRAMFGLQGDLGVSKVHAGLGHALIFETFLTSLLIVVILGTASGHRIVGHNAGVAVGSTIALCGLFAAPISGASMNPARSLGPALVSGNLTDSWIYVVGPLLGAIVAVTLTYILHGPPDAKERETATGDK